MCFTNLPVQFDEDGNPYLEDEAEDIEHPSECDHDHHDHPEHDYTSDMETVGSVSGDPGPALDDLDSDEVYGSVMETLPDSARDQIAAADIDHATDIDADTSDRDTDTPDRNTDTPDRDTDTGTYEPAQGD